MLFSFAASKILIFQDFDILGCRWLLSCAASKILIFLLENGEYRERFMFDPCMMVMMRADGRERHRERVQFQSVCAYRDSETLN